MKMTKILMGMMSAVIALNALATDPVISDVVARQRWPWSRLVDIDYVLKCDLEQLLDIAVEAYNGASRLTLPLGSFSGDLYGVSCGARRIVWDPTLTAYTNNSVLPEFRVTLTPTPSPLYMIVDLTKDTGASNQIEYVTEAALHSGAYGTVETNPVVDVNSVIWTGVTNDTVYMTDKLVLRRVPAGSFQMGATQDGNNNVTLTKHMYVGIFQVTQQHWNHVMNTTGGTDTQAKHTVSYYEIRENYAANTNDPAVDWPSNTAVNASSFMGKLRARTGIPEFDLPTEAQWEYFCRAGTTTYYNDGLGTPANTTSNAQMNALGWYKHSTIPSPTAAQTVGGKQPNAWGLYDTHGNVWEWCLDWYTISLAGGDDPKGAGSGSCRVRRGGCWRDTATCRSSLRNDSDPSLLNYSVGFRLVRTLP